MSERRFLAVITTAALVASAIQAAIPNEERAPVDIRPGILTAAAALATDTTQTTATIVPTTVTTAPRPEVPETTLPRVSSTTAPSEVESANTDTPPPPSPPTTTPADSAPTTTAPAPPPPQGGFRNDLANQFVSNINGLRTSNGLAALTRSGSLDSEARWWAQSMAGSGSLSHSNIGRLLPPWSAAAENLGSGGSVSAIFGALAGSSGHYSNMVGNYTHVGAGVWVDASGKLWTVHLFTR